MASTFSIFLCNFGVNTAPGLFWALFAFAIAVPLISMTRAKTARGLTNMDIWASTGSAAYANETLQTNTRIVLSNLITVASFVRLGMVRIWSLNTWKRKRLQTGHINAIFKSKIVFSADRESGIGNMSATFKKLTNSVLTARKRRFRLPVTGITNSVHRPGLPSSEASADFGLADIRTIDDEQPSFLTFSQNEKIAGRNAAGLMNMLLFNDLPIIHLICLPKIQLTVTGIMYNIQNNCLI
jgi:hypothetical protein